MRKIYVIFFIFCCYGTIIPIQNTSKNIFKVRCFLCGFFLNYNDALVDKENANEFYCLSCYLKLKGKLDGASATGATITTAAATVSISSSVDETNPPVIDNRGSIDLVYEAQGEEQIHGQIAAFRLIPRDHRLRKAFKKPKKIRATLQQEEMLDDDSSEKFF